MAAGVHAPFVLRSVCKLVGLLQGKGVQIGTQTHRAQAVATAQDPHDTRAGHAGVHF